MVSFPQNMLAGADQKELPCNAAEAAVAHQEGEGEHVLDSLCKAAGVERELQEPGMLHPVQHLQTRQLQLMRVEASSYSCHHTFLCCLHRDVHAFDRLLSGQASPNIDLRPCYDVVPLAQKPVSSIEHAAGVPTSHTVLFCQSLTVPGKRQACHGPHRQQCPPPTSPPYSYPVNVLLVLGNLAVLWQASILDPPCSAAKAEAPGIACDRCLS